MGGLVSVDYCHVINPSFLSWREHSKSLDTPLLYFSEYNHNHIYKLATRVVYLSYVFKTYRNIMSGIISPNDALSTTHSDQSSTSTEVSRARNRGRKGHRKSRQGCFNCKQRKIKVRFHAILTDTELI